MGFDARQVNYVVDCKIIHESSQDNKSSEKYKYKAFCYRSVNRFSNKDSCYIAVDNTLFLFFNII